MAKDNDVSDQTERLLDALEGSTRVTTEVIGHVKGMQREFQTLRESNASELAHLRETFNTRVGSLEGEMKTTNSHLDNLVRETGITNQLLREDMTDRKEQQRVRVGVEEEDRKWRRKIELKQLNRTAEVEDADRAGDLEDKRTKTDMVKGVANEFWGVLKQPLAYLVAGVIFWLLTQYSAIPPTTMMLPTVSPVAEQGSL